MTDFLFIASDYKPLNGGIATYVDNLARGLKEIGNKIRVLAVVPKDEKERIKFLKNYEDWVSVLPVSIEPKPSNWLGRKYESLLEILRFSIPRAGYILDRTKKFHHIGQLILELKKILDRERPGMVVFGHLDTKLYPLVLVLNDLNIPYGIIAHDAEIYRHTFKTEIMIIKGTMLKGAKWVAANSHHTESLVRMWKITKNKTLIVHPAVSELLMREADKPYPVVRNPEYSLLTVSRLVKSKGIDLVLHALKILDENGIPFRYIISGDGDERLFLEHLASELDIKKKIQFLGYITEEEKMTLFRNADVFVMPSRVNPKVNHEGFGIGFIEAAVFGIPGVGTRAGGIPDAIVHGETGLLVPQESPEELSQALIFLYENPEKRIEMGQAAKKRARGQFSPNAIANHFQKEVRKKMQ